MMKPVLNMILPFSFLQFELHWRFRWTGANSLSSRLRGLKIKYISNFTFSTLHKSQHARLANVLCNA